MAESPTIRNHAAFIRSVADLLRGDYKQSEYGKVILALVALRRLDSVLEPTKAKVLAEHERHGDRDVILAKAAAEQGALSGKYLCRGGEVIYSKIRPALRKVCIAPSECVTSADMYPLLSIQLLDERKQALITAAVTGHLDLARDIAEEAS